MLALSFIPAKSFKYLTELEFGLSKTSPFIFVEVDPFKKGAAYFVGTRYKSDDFTPYIYKTEDYGKTWKLIVNGINRLHF